MLQHLIKTLHVPKGVSFREFSSQWLKEISVDTHSVLTDPLEIALRLERLGSYLPYLSTLIAIYRFKGREERDSWYTANPKADKAAGTTVKDYEESRDSTTHQYRYMYDLLVQLREDIQTRVSTSQSLLAYHRQELKSHVAD